MCGCGVQREVGFGVCSCEEFILGLVCDWRAESGFLNLGILSNREEYEVTEIGIQVFVIARSVLKTVSHFGLKWRRLKKKRQPGEYTWKIP